MAETAIHADGLGKRYRIGVRRDPYDTLRESLVRGLRRLSRDRPSEGRDLWALRDVSLEIASGEAVGLIGRNGAGKTTLLRLLSRITYPTEGRAEVHGRVGSLLEVGTGFHPELTGRENVYLNGAVLGMRRREIRRKFDEIVEFAGVEKFLETPIKRYSSGMYVRLAFSVAAHLDPEILLVDEVLAVGDAEFQRKCLGRMEEIGRSGRTVVFVSHSMQAVTRLCERAIVLEGGRVVADGPSLEVVPRYLQSGLGSSATRDWRVEEAPGNDVVRLRRLRVVDADGAAVDGIDVRSSVGIEIGFDVLREAEPVRPQIMLTNEQGVHAFTAMNTDPRWRKPTPPGSYVTTAWVPPNLLNEGLMTITVFLSTLAPGKTIQHVLERDVLAFHVHDPAEGDSAKGDHVGQWHGAVRPLLDWTTEEVGRLP